MRIYRRWEKWECFKAGFYETTFQDLDKESAKIKYADFLGNLKRFKKGLGRVLKEWPNSCDHFLSNQGTNRIAWLGQAAMCIETGIPSIFRGGYKLLSEKKRKQADGLALVYLKKWESRKR